MGVSLSIIRIIQLVHTIFSVSILINVILSWIPNIDPDSNDILRTINKIANLVLDPIREALYKIGLRGPIDISPLIGLILLDVAKSFLIRIII